MKWIFVLLALCSGSVSATVYKCEVNGVITFSQTPCGDKSTQVYSNVEIVEAAANERADQKTCQVMHDGKWFQYPANKCIGKGVYEMAPSTSNSNKQSSYLSKSQTEFDDDSRTICKHKWTKRGELDTDMYLHCLKGQEEGYSELVLMSRYANQAFFKDTALPHCEKKWTTRGVTDARMLAYCLEQEIDGYDDVTYFIKQHGEDKVNRVVAKALLDFGSWNMAAHKVKEEIHDMQ